MAEQVTGFFGQEQIALDNAASEETLLELLDVVSAMATKQGINTSTAQKAIRDLAKSSREAADGADKELKSKRELAKAEWEYKAAKSKSKAAIQNFGAAVSSAISTFLGFESAFMSMGDSLSSGASVFEKVPIIGGALGQYFGNVAQAADRSSKALFQAAQVGATMGGELGVLVRQAGQAGLTLEQYSGIVSKNGELLARLGNGTADGSRRFAEMSRLMRTEVTKGLGNLGITTEEANEVMASYTGRLAREGRARSMSEEELVSRTREYLGHLTAVSRLTGASRRELEEQAQARQRDASWQSWLASLEDPDVRGAADEAMRMFDALGVGDLARDMIVAGAPLSEVTQRIAAMNPALADAMGEFSQAADAGDAEAMQRLTERIYNETRSMAEELEASGMADALRIIAAQGGPAEQALLDLATRARGLTEDFNGVFDSVRTEMDPDRGTQAQALIDAQQKLAEKSAEEIDKVLKERFGELITALDNIDIARLIGEMSALIKVVAAAAGLLAARRGLRALRGARGAGATGQAAGARGGGMMRGAGRMALGAARFAGPLALGAQALHTAYGAFRGFGQAAENFELAEGEAATAGQKISSAFGGAIESLTFGLLDSGRVSRAVHKMGEHVSTLFGNLGDRIKDGLGSAREKISEWGDSIREGFDNAKERISNTWDSARGKISEWGDSITQGFENAKERISNTWDSARGKISEWGDVLRNGYDNLREIAGGFFAGLRERAGNVVASARELIPDINPRESLATARSKITNTFSRLNPFAGGDQDTQLAEETQIPDALGSTIAEASEISDAGSNPINNLVDRLDQLIRTTVALHDLNRQQLIAMRGMSGNMLTSL